MSAHLSSEQISNRIAGESNPDAERHIQECPQCAKEIDRLKALLGSFRLSVIEWNALQKGAKAPAHWMQIEHRRQFVGGPLRWKPAVAALIIVLAVPIWKNINDRHREVVEAFEADVRLWEEVNDRISRPVPSSMEPLMNLVVWEPDSVEK
jgi:hypothetical protein